MCIYFQKYEVIGAGYSVKGERFMSSEEKPEYEDGSVEETPLALQSAE